MLIIYQFMVWWKNMAIRPKIINPNEQVITLIDFLRSYNNTIPESFPRASIAALKKYKDEHGNFFKDGDAWSLDLHRKKIMDWLPNNLKNNN